MSSFSVNPEELHALRSNIEARAKNIVERLENLDSEVGKLRAAWDGQAQQSYDQAQAKWNRSIAEMNSLLQRAGLAAGQIGSQYTESDRQSARRFS